MLNTVFIARIYFIITLISFFGRLHGQSLQYFQGSVTNQNNQPVAGAEVKLLNSNFSAITTSSGKFRFSGRFLGKYKIQISAAGYASITKIITISDEPADIDFVLISDAKQLNEVLITAQKKEDNAQNVPASVSTFSAENIAAYHLQNSKEITALVPNLYAANPGDNRNVISIRGIATTSYDPTVVTYIDGVSQFSLDTYIAQLFDIERVEVLRGPQGTLYGRNAMGGVINIITKEPTNKTSGFGGIEFGNYGGQRYTFGLRAPLIKNKLFFGVAGLYSQLNGYYENVFNNTKFDRQHTFEGNYFLKYLPAKDWKITLNVKHNANRNNGAFPLVSSVEDALANPYQVNQNAITKMIDNLFNASLSANYAGRYFNFSSQTAYQSNRRYYVQPIDGDFSPADAVSLVNNYGGYQNKVQVLTQEFRFNSPANINAKLNWTGGIYAYYQDNPTKQGTYFGDDAGLVGSPITDFTSINTNYGKNAGIAFYGQATYNLTQKLDLTLGLRYDYEHEKLTIKGAFQPNGQPEIISQPDTSSNAASHAFSPKAGLTYHFSNSKMLYATYSRGFRTGGISQLSSDPSQPPLVAYQPEYSNNFEIGSKNTFFNNRLRVNFAAFYLLVDHAQVPTLILPDAITITKNAGKLHSKGLEIELAATPFKGLAISNNTGITQARYTSLVLPVDGKTINGDQNRPVFSPNATSATAVDYRFAFTKNQKNKLFFHGDWIFIGDQFFDLANTIEQKSYHLFNGTIGFSTGKTSISFWEKNISGKKYIDYAYDFGAAHLGNPRTFGVSLNQKF